MKREILINGSPRETRVAILEDDRLVELLVDRPDQRRTVGDIYLGRVEQSSPGIQAAFVDIGLEKSAFLHASDLLEPTRTTTTPRTDDPTSSRPRPTTAPERGRGRRQRSGDDAEAGAGAASGATAMGRAASHASARSRAGASFPTSPSILKKGEILPVQVTKEPISTKGCRVTAQISLAGRFLVYMPYASKVGVSAARSRAASSGPSCARWSSKLAAQGCRRRDRPHRRRGRDRGALPARDRLAAQHLEEDQAQADVRRARRRRCCSARRSLTRGIIRDLFSAKVDALWVDSQRAAPRDRASTWSRSIPELIERVQLYDEPTPLFDKFDIETGDPRPLQAARASCRPAAT